MPENSYRFAGFISYSQKDKRWAQRIHKALETYRLPVGLPASAEIEGRKLGRFFRDDDELAGAPSLGAALTGALDDSRTLIVICSPNAAQSKWVDAEIRHFKARGPDARVLAVIVDGQPDSTDPDVMCFPPSLLRKVDSDGNLTDEPDEPLAPDASKEAFDRLIARLVAGLVGVAFDALWQREKRRKRRRQLVTGLVGLVLLAAAAIGYAFYDDAVDQQLVEESVNLAAQAQKAMDDGRLGDAADLVTRALPSDVGSPDRPLVQEAAAALRRLMSANLSEGVIRRFETAIMDVRLLPDSTLMVALDGGEVVVIDRNGSELRRFPADERLRWAGSGALAYTTFSDERADADGNLIVTHRAKVRDLASGKLLRSLDHRQDGWWLGPFAPLSPDGSRVVAVAWDENEGFNGHRFAVWQLPEVAGGSPRTVAEVTIPRIDQDGLITTEFAADDIVVITWGSARKGALIWTLTDNTYRLLSAPDEGTRCGHDRDGSEKIRDSIALSADRTLLTLARPVTEEEWCISVWNVRTGEALEPVLYADGRIAGADALDAHTLAIQGSPTGWQQQSGLLVRGSERVRPIDCLMPRKDMFGLRADSGRWIIDDSIRRSICANDTVIDVESGQHMEMGQRLRGHSQTISAVAYDPASAMLFSGGGDGELRAWNLNRGARDAGLSGPAVAVSGWGGLVAAIHDPDDAPLLVQMFHAGGEKAGSPFPFPVAGMKMDPVPGRRVQLSAWPLAEPHALLVESHDCGFLGCPPGTPRRGTLVNWQDGSRVPLPAELGYGGFLANMTVSVAFDGTRERLALTTTDGRAFVVQVRDGTTTELGVPEGWHARQALFVGRSIWMLADDRADEPVDREIVLLRFDENGTSSEMSRVRAQGARLFPSESGNAAVISFDVIHEAQSRPQYQVIRGDSISHAFEMPFPRMSGESLQAVSFFDADAQVALFFPDQSAPPQLVRIAEDGKVDTNAISTLIAALPASMLQAWRTDDPEGRAVISVHDSRFFMQPLGDPDGVCPELIGQDADAAAFSPDGALLAVSDDRAEVTRLYDTRTCNLVQEVGSGAAHNRARLVFGDHRTLWLLTDRGDLFFSNVETDLGKLQQRARQLLGDRSVREE
ncbi:toll/interleukin-1 receptor domain-containing protein [Minwuia sp.]|uniref:toll/interleukin-1 receptor domain-containing protein n=1 Tax=Minwuia sp. TaxID=2493630 RepID=UPI003A8EA3DA